MLLLIYILLLFNVLAPNVSFWYALFPKFAILCEHLLSSGKCDLSDISWGRAVLCWYIIGGAKSCQITAHEIGRENLRKRTARPRWCEARQRVEEVLPRVDLHLLCSQEMTASRSAKKSCDPIMDNVCGGVVLWPHHIMDKPLAQDPRNRRCCRQSARLDRALHMVPMRRCSLALSVMFGRAQSEVIGVKLAGCGYITSSLVNL